MRDAAYASNIDATWTGAVGGYLHVGNPYHPWTVADWRRFRFNRKLPIAKISKTKGRNPIKDALASLEELYAIGCKSGSMVVLDLETTVDPLYTSAYGNVMKWCGFHVLPYGSTGSLFKNPPLYGYWVSSPNANVSTPYMYAHASIRMTQYAINVNNKHDSSTVRWSTWTNGVWWV